MSDGKRRLAARCLALLVALSPIFFRTPAVAASEAPAATLNTTMSEIGEVMVEFFPLILARRSLSDQELAYMGRYLDRLARLFDEAGPFIRERPETYQLSYELILDYIDDLRDSYRRGDIEQARSSLYGLGPICTSCHTQDTQLRTLFRGAGRERFGDDFAYAEFNYLTRNYDEAERYYDRYLESLRGRRTELDIVLPLQRLVTIYAQIRNQPGEGARRLQRYLDLPGHSRLTREHLAGWIAGLERLDRSGVTHLRSVNLALLEKYVGRYLGPLAESSSRVHLPADEEVERVWLRGLIYHYLNTGPPRREMPRLYYWLALCDRAIGYDFYFSLADLYLRECVTGYAAYPYANRCMDEYENYITHFYSGAGGTFIPPEVRQELHAMRRLLQQQQGLRPPPQP